MPLQAPSSERARRLRFLAVGAWNTAFGYLAFAVCYRAVRALDLHYLWATLPAHLISVLNAFVFHRRLVFGGTGPFFAELFRFSLVYWTGFFISLGLLPLLVSVAGLHPLVAQALMTFGWAVASYVAHSRFSFSAARSEG